MTDSSAKAKVAFDFCSKVYSEILNVTARLEADLPEAIIRVVTNDLEERYEKVDATLPKVTTAGGMFFSLCDSARKQTFDEAFRSFQECKEKLLASIPQMKLLHVFLRSIEAHK